MSDNRKRLATMVKAVIPHLSSVINLPDELEAAHKESLKWVDMYTKKTKEAFAKEEEERTARQAEKDEKRKRKMEARTAELLNALKLPRKS